jgi:hypothetical protein
MYAKAQHNDPPKWDGREPLLSPAQVSKLLPSQQDTDGTGERVHIRTVLRWALQGYPMPDGSRLTLPHRRTGEGFGFWRSAVVWFLDRITEAKTRPAGPAPRMRSERQTQRAQQRSSREFRRMAGVKE